MTTTTRLLELLSLLQTGRDWPGSLLADRLNVGGRTVRRDVERLREMGYRIDATMGPEGGYRLHAGSDLPPLLFDEDQTLAVAIALRTAPALGAGIDEAAIRALGTIRQVMPSRLRRRLDALDVSVVGHTRDALEPARDVLVTLANAIRDRETLSLDYAPVAADALADDPRAPPPTRRVEPHHLVTSRGRWYLVGWDLDRDDWRLFRVERVRPRSPGRRFTPRTVPGGDVDAFVSARFKGSERLNAWPCRGKVRLARSAREVLPFVGEGTVTAIDDRSCAIEAGAWSWGSLAAYFGGFEARMEVIEPPELAAAFGALAERCAEAARP